MFWPACDHGQRSRDRFKSIAMSLNEATFSVTYITTIGLRYGLTEDTQISVSAPFAYASESARTTFYGQTFNQHLSSSSLAESISLQLSSTVASAAKGAVTLKGDTQVAVTTRGEIAGGAAGVSATWIRDDTKLPVLTGHAGVTHTRALSDDDLAITSAIFSSTIVATIDSDLNAFLTAGREFPLDVDYPDTATFQLGLAYAPTPKITLQPYLSFDISDSQLTHGFGLSVTFNAPRKMF